MTMKSYSLSSRNPTTFLLQKNRWVSTSPLPCYTQRQKLIFHTRFRSVTSLLEMKREQDFMLWLKAQKIYTTVMTSNTTANTRVRFFLGKGPHFTNLKVFAEWVKKRILETTAYCPKFQLKAEVIGRFKDPSTKSRAIVVICSQTQVDNLKDLIDQVFHAESNFPFAPFWVMYTLDACTHTALYKTHKSRTYGSDPLEIGIPDFHDLDTTVVIGKTSISLHNMCFDLKTKTRGNIFVDVGNATCIGKIAFQVKKTDKDIVQEAIDTWIKTHLNI